MNMSCKCTCGGCDCPRVNVALFPNVANAGAAQVNYQAWAPANGAQHMVVNYHANACAGAAAPILSWHNWRV